MDDTTVETTEDQDLVFKTTKFAILAFAAIGLYHTEKLVIEKTQILVTRTLVKRAAKKNPAQR